MTTQYAVLKGLPNGLVLDAGKLFTLASPDTVVTGNTFSFSNRTNANTQYVVEITRATALPAGDYTLIAYIGSSPKAEIALTFLGTDGETATETARLAELDSGITADIADIKADSAAAAGYGADLVAKITSNVATALAKLYYMITGTGVDSKFTAKAVEDAPGADGGLTSEQDELLTTIGQQTAQITGARLSVAGPVTPGGQISLVVGSDYVDDIDSSLIRTVTDAGETLHDALTAGELSDLVFRAAPKSNATATNKITGTVAAVSHAGGVTSITITIARANIPNGPYDEDWKYQIWRTTDDHVSPPLLEGQLLLHWRA